MAEPLIPGGADPGQDLDAACGSFLDWLDRRVLVTGRGDDLDRLDVAPAATFWLGRLASEEEVLASGLGDRADRLDPCAIGIRVRPAGPPPWSFTVRATARAWLRHEQDPDGRGRWYRTPAAEVSVPVVVQTDTPDVVVTAGDGQWGRALDATGAGGLAAEVRVEVQRWHGEPELVVQLVNSGPHKHPGLVDTHLYETVLEVHGLATEPFQLEALPDSFRYDRAVPAYGVNVGVEVLPGDPPGFRSTDTVTVTTRRPTYWTSRRPAPDLSFDTLAEDPLPSLRSLVDAVEEYLDENWSAAVLNHRTQQEQWDPPMRAKADAAAGDVAEEARRLRRGVDLLAGDATLLRAFRLMNRAIEHSAAGRYPGWRPFQVGFLLGSLAFLIDPAAEARIVDTVWFATGGGKTETYLGLLVTAALHDRLTGKTSGVTAWSRFPLRLLSLQQTQRFADALAGAELVRRRERIGGAPFALGFLVGRSSTPNKVVATAGGDDVDPDSPGMPDRYQVILRCPFCRASDVAMRFDRELWRLAHTCVNPACPWPTGTALPLYVVDQEIYRYLPTVVLGTLDKAASIGMQAAMRGLVGPPLGLCDVPGHGYTYAPRKNNPSGCLVPGCTGQRKALPIARERYAPSLRLQDELHLLRDSLGAVDSHYESLLDHLQAELGAHPAKVVASSATLTGYERQVDVLYQRAGRVFPQPGPRSGESFWTGRSDAPLRRFVAVAPRGVTLDHVSDRTLDTLQNAVRELAADPDRVCAEAGVDTRHADRLLGLYGTDVVYGSTLYDVEAATRSIASNTTAEGINAVQLTGQTAFDDVRDILERFEHPEPDFRDRIHVVAASSMLSHGVDVERLNVMVMLGLPLANAEFIQTTARVGRRYPGLVHVLHKIARERDAATFRHFGHYVTHGDRFVEAIPITRRSRRVLRLTMPGIVEARRLALMEPASPGQRLTMLRLLRDYARSEELTVADQSAVVAALLGFTGPVDDLLRDEVTAWFGDWFTNLHDPATAREWPSDLGATKPMMSLRDVETSVPIHD